jgi:hypothetical protein
VPILLLQGGFTELLPNLIKASMTPEEDADEFKYLLPSLRLGKGGISICSRLRRKKSSYVGLFHESLYL